MCATATSAITQTTITASCGRLYQSAVGNLEATHRGLDTAKLARIVKRMDQSRAVYLVGDTRDLYCFYSLQMDLMCRGKTVYFCNIDEVTADLLSDLDSRSVLCVFSVCSEYYQDARRLVFREARQKNAAVPRSRPWPACLIPPTCSRKCSS